MSGLDVWEIWLLISCLSLLAVWGVVEFARWVDRRNPLAHTRRMESARRDWARMIESSCFYRQGK